MQGKLKKEWKVLYGNTWSAARSAAWDAAQGAARDAALDAALMASIKICTGLKLDKKFKLHAEARWEVWKRGYGLLCDVNGVLYVYARGP